MQRKYSSMAAANISVTAPIFERGIKVEKRGDAGPATGNSDASEKAPPENNSPPDMSSQGVDSTSMQGIPSLKNLFEKGTVRAPAMEAVPLCTPKPIQPALGNLSLTAAIIATQLPSSSSTHSLRKYSLILEQSSKPTQGVNASASFSNRPSPHGTTHEPLPFLQELEEPSLLKKHAFLGQNDALLAVNLAARPRSSKDSSIKPQPPKPPPPRRGKNDFKHSGSKALEHEDKFPQISVKSSSTYDTAHSSMPLKPSLSHSTTLPERRLSLGEISHQSTCNESFIAVSAAALPSAPIRGNGNQPLPSPPCMTGDSAAQYRVNSPAPRNPPAPPPPCRERRKSLPPPPKMGLRDTVREPRSPPIIADPQRKIPNIVKDHPHQHSEGGHRRWRHHITELERKRYEMLWAANKGLGLVTCNLNSKGNTSDLRDLQNTKSHGPHKPQGQKHVWSTPNCAENLSDCVDSLVVRDIWTRSRLPADNLADIWDLVDRGMKGRLSRDEFVVGMWLVDQGLKGRKLPMSVQDEVWQSAKRLGVKMPPPVRRSATYI